VSGADGANCDGDDDGGGDVAVEEIGGQLR